MKFVAISDTHGCHRQLELPKGDVLLHAGDVCDQGNQEQVVDFLEWIEQLDFAHKIIIRGNHDIDLKTQNSLLDIDMPKGIIQLHYSGIEIEGKLIWGVPFPLHRNNKDWKNIPEETQILISHQPPYSILDQPPFSPSVGSRSLLEITKRIEPKVHLFGHIHADYGSKQIGITQFYNASLYKASKQMIVNEPFVFELI